MINLLKNALTAKIQSFLIKLDSRLNNKPKLKQWLWFLMLSASGLLLVTLLALFLKFLLFIGR